MENVLQVLTIGDFDMPYPIAICTELDKAEKLIKKHANRFRKVIVNYVEPNKYKVRDNINGEPYDYWIKEVKLNTLI
jgi:hypothetical protein